MLLRGRPSRSIARAADDQRLGRIEPAGDADHQLLRARSPAAAWPGPGPGCCRPRSSPRASRAGSDGTKGNRSTVAAQPHALGRARRARTRPLRNGRLRRRSAARAVAEAVRRACAPGGCGRGRRRHGDLGGRLKTARSRPAASPISKIPAWPSQARSVVDSPGAGGGVEVGGDAARRLRRAEQAPQSAPCRW